MRKKANYQCLAMMKRMAVKPEGLENAPETYFGNRTTTLQVKFNLDNAGAGYTVMMGSTRAGMSAQKS